MRQIPFLIVAILWAAGLSYSRSKEAALDVDPALLLSDTLPALVTQATSNEAKVFQLDGIYMRYKVKLSNSRGDQERDVVESRDGRVARLIRKGGRALTADEDKDERARLQTMIDFPAEFTKHIKGELRSKKIAVEMVKLIPDAMHFDYAPGQPQSDRVGPHAREIVLDFHPNPKWVPPNMTAEALTGIEGRLWIDSKSHYVVRLDGRIFRAINFGFGMLAHVYPGGTVSLEQQDAGQGHWRVSHFAQHATARALLVKTLREDNEMRGEDLRPIPPMSYQDAIRLLLSTPLPR